MRRSRIFWMRDITKSHLWENDRSPRRSLAARASGIRLRIWRNQNYRDWEKVLPALFLPMFCLRGLGFENERRTYDNKNKKAQSFAWFPQNAGWRSAETAQHGAGRHERLFGISRSTGRYDDIQVGYSST